MGKSEPMATPLGRRRIALGASLAVALAAALVVVLSTTGGARAGSHRRARPANRSIPRNALQLEVGAPIRVHPIRPGFLGLSIEYPSIESYAGTDPSDVNPVFVQLIRAITPDQRPVLRIGGDSTDWMWWPVAHMRKPSGVRYALTPRWMAVTKALTDQLNARLIVGLDLAVNNLAVERAEAHAFVSGLGNHAVEAVEPGNEPELYGSWPWYLKHGNRVYGRPASWNLGSYEHEFGQLRSELHGLALAGPATGSPKWSADLPKLLRAVPYLRLVTLHRYPLQLCYTPPSAPKYPTIAHLLSTQASRGLAGTVAPYVRIALAHGVPIRIGEMNTNSCGRSPRVTDSYASALWAVDALFAMANAGVDGVNIHTYNSSSYALFSFSHAHGQWQARVEPEYYGLLMFAEAAPPGSRLIRLYGPATHVVRAWATRAPDGRLRITLINDDLRHAETVAISAPTKNTATLTSLRAPSITSRTHVTITERSVAASGRDYVIRVPAASAVLLTC